MSDSNTVFFSLAVIGALCVCRIVFLSWIPTFYRHFLRQPKDLQKIYGNGSTGSSATWVAVTGPTGSLGLDYCREFAKRGFNILFIARNETKAEAKISLLKKEFPAIETSFIKCDLGKLNSPDLLNDFRSSINNFYNGGKDIGILINNAGIEEDAHRWGDLRLERNMAMLNVNMLAAVILTQLMLPHLEKRSRDGRKRSLVINIGSTLGTVELPGVAIYSSCKAFLNRWSIAASKEYESIGIDFAVTNPGGMESDMMPIKENILLGISSTRTYAEKSMKHFGYGRTRAIVALWYHELMIAPIIAIQSLSREIGLVVAYDGFVATFRKIRDSSKQKQN